MFAWIQGNLASLAVGALLLLMVILIIRKLIRDKKAGKHLCGCGGSCSSCGGGCGGCPSCGGGSRGNSRSRQ